MKRVILGMVLWMLLIWILLISLLILMEKLITLLVMGASRNNFVILCYWTLYFSRIIWTSYALMLFDFIWVFLFKQFTYKVCYLSFFFLILIYICLSIYIYSLFLGRMNVRTSINNENICPVGNAMTHTILKNNNFFISISNAKKSILVLYLVSQM